jgi:CBS domain-containing protein
MAGGRSMSNADEFIRLFNDLSAHLCGLTGLDQGTPFWRLVDEAGKKNATVKKHAGQVKALGKLRNAIVHHERFPPEVVAEPNDRALGDFRAIAHDVMAPELVMPRFRAEVRCFKPHDWLDLALQHMREHAYSQVAVRDEGRLRLLTTEGVALWFAARPVWDPDSVQHATIRDALNHDLPDGFLILRANQSIDDARDAFATELGRGQVRLYALLITPSGDPTEEPIGIVTPWDLLAPQDA